MERLISEKIRDDAKPVRGCQAEIKRCFSIQEKVNGLLDVARDTYTKLLTEVEGKFSEILTKILLMKLRKFKYKGRKHFSSYH